MRIKLSKTRRLNITRNRNIKKFRFNYVDSRYIFLNIPWIKIMFHYYAVPLYKS